MLPIPQMQRDTYGPGDNTETFATYYRDADSGLDYAVNRYFNPSSGRFLSADPYQASAGAEDPGSWYRSAYVGGDPTNFFDPSGLKSESTPVSIARSRTMSSGHDL